MIKIFKHIVVSSILFTTVSAYAQTTINSPYSQFGLGELKDPLLPQNRGMGGISMGIRKLSRFSNINLANPASYSSIQLTTFDVGAFGGIRQLANSSTSQKSFNGTLSHLAFAVPVNKKSALSFGLLPFSDFGFKYKNSAKIDTTDIDYVYSGEGGLSKAYLGYGILLTKNLSVGFNLGYLFGNLKNSKSAEFPNEPLFMNSRRETSKSINGLRYDYGLQYETKTSSKTKLTIGYTGNAGTKLSLSSSEVITQYRKNYNTQEETRPLDGSLFSQSKDGKVKMPTTHKLGFAFEKNNKWLVGADASYSRWSDYREGTTNPDLNDSYGVNLGAQITPDITAIANYLKIVDYRLGFKYDRTFIQIGDNDIKQYGITAGLGLPLQSTRSSVYKINFSAEFGQRGTIDNGLVRERFVNFNLGFTLNDKWFNKAKID